MAESGDPREVGQTQEGHAGLQSAEQHEMEAVNEEEDETEEAIERAEQEEAADS